MNRNNTIYKRDETMVQVADEGEGGRARQDGMTSKGIMTIVNIMKQQKQQSNAMMR